MEEIGYVMIQIFLLLFLAEVLGQVMKRINIPEMVGYILGGIIFVNLTVFIPSFGDYIHFNIADIEVDSNHFLNIMGQIGLVFLMFGIGLKTKLSDLVDVGKTAIIIALASTIIPFLGGYSAYYLFDNDPNVAIMVGTALFASSTTIAVNMLNHFNISDTKQGKLVIGVCIVIDILCLVILAVNTSIVSPVQEHSGWINILVILVFVAFVFLFIAHTKHRSEKRKHLMKHLNLRMEDIHKGLFVIAIVTCFGLTAFSYLVGLSGIVGAFLAGMYFAEFEASTHIHKKFNTLTRFLLPFFFIYVGLRLHFDVMGVNTITIAVTLIVVAIITKHIGGFIGCKLCKMNNTDSNFIASCIIARGDIAIIVATLAHELNLFDTDMYAAVIIMAVATQILAPIIISRFYKKTKLSKEMEKESEKGTVAE